MIKDVKTIKLLSLSTSTMETFLTFNQHQQSICCKDRHWTHQAVRKSPVPCGSLQIPADPCGALPVCIECKSHRTYPGIEFIQTVLSSAKLWFEGLQFVFNLCCSLRTMPLSNSPDGLLDGHWASKPALQDPLQQISILTTNRTN